MVLARRAAAMAVLLALMTNVDACGDDAAENSSATLHDARPPADHGGKSPDAGSVHDASAPEDSDGPASIGPACPYLVDQCAPYDPGSGQVHACAKLGQDGDEALCGVGLDACRKACATASKTEPRDASHVVRKPDAGTTKPPHEAGSPMMPEGGPSPGYPEASTTPDAGLNVCQKIGAVCAKIDPGTGPVHDCAVLRDSSDLDACNARLDDCSSLCGQSICVRLGSICHDVDPGSGPIHDCHFGGHAGVASWCFDNALHCYAICEAAAEGQ